MTCYFRRSWLTDWLHTSWLIDWVVELIELNWIELNWIHLVDKKNKKSVEETPKTKRCFGFVNCVCLARDAVLLWNAYVRFRGYIVFRKDASRGQLLFPIFKRVCVSQPTLYIILDSPFVYIKKCIYLSVLVCILSFFYAIPFPHISQAIINRHVLSSWKEHNPSEWSPSCSYSEYRCVCLRL